MSAPRTTAETMSDEQIAALRGEAYEAGDVAMASACDRALVGDGPALLACLSAIQNAEAQDPDEQCPEHGCAAWRCDDARHGKVAS